MLSFKETVSSSMGKHLDFHLDDECWSIRKIAVTRNIAAWRNQPENIGKFTAPRLRFDTKDYTPMIHWNVVTELPLLKKLANDQFWQIVDDPVHYLTKIRSLPCHTQAVKRHMKLVTEASLAVSRMDRRNGSIRAKIQSRSKLPKFDTKYIYIQKMKTRYRHTHNLNLVQNVFFLRKIYCWY
jgi:hypothetical protein